METANQITVPHWISSLPGYCPCNDIHADYTISGNVWQHTAAYGLEGAIYLHQEVAPHYRINKISRHEVKWHWSAALNIDNKGTTYVRSSGYADSLEEAAALALAWDFHPTTTPDGHTWYRGKNCPTFETWETWIDGKTISIHRTAAHGDWHWSHPVDLSPLEQIGARFDYSGPCLEGYHADLEEAMKAAAKAEFTLHRTLLQMAAQLAKPITAESLSTGKTWRAPYSHTVVPCHCAATTRDDCTCHPLLSPTGILTPVLSTEHPLESEADHTAPEAAVQTSATQPKAH